MNTFRYIFVVLVLSFIVGFPYKASAKEIPFYITCDITKDCPQKDPILLIQCNGPWGRASWPSPQPTFGAIHEKFYTAEETIFSPYGGWTCCTFPDDGRNFTSCLPIQQYVARKSFKLTKSDSEVSLTMTKDSLSVSLTEDSNTITAKATLGDNKTIFRRGRDRDTWSMQGTGGDKVIITLEEDKAAGHMGEEATLILRGGANGRSTIETNTGTLPMEIMATLPSSGEYEIVVENHGIPEDVRFRGNYFLSIESASGEIEEIRPSVNVEP